MMADQQLRTRSVQEKDGRLRVAIFGGSFNPPHVAHVLAASYVLSVEPVDEVLVVPVYQHPFSKELAPFSDRMAMCQLALGWLPHVQISSIEQELGGESRTLRTLEQLESVHPDWSMRLVLGADVLSELPKWHRFDRIEQIAPPLILGRVGVTFEGAPKPILPGISSTEVREAMEAGCLDAVHHLLPRLVLAYILDHGLYRRDEG